MNTIKTILNRLNSIIIAGFMIMLYGVLFLIYRGGVLLPFHDAPDEVMLIYSTHAEVGKTIIKLGFITLIVGVIYQIIKSIYVKQKSIQQKDSIIDLITMLMLGVVIASGLISIKGFTYLFEETEFDAVGDFYGLNYGYARSVWMSLMTKSSIIFLVVSLITSIWILCKSKKSSLIAYILLGVIWSVLCFFVFIWAVFYGNWHWSTSELIANEPVMGRITVFLSNTMWLIWLLVPCIIAGIMLYKKKKNNI